MHIRCPHCHQPVEFVDRVEVEDIDCPSCGSRFSLLGDRTLSHRGAQPRSVGHFELIEPLGAGQFGTVWLAHDTELDRVVAVKIPRREQLGPDDVEMFLREARAAAQLRHPNIVSVHEVGRQGDTIYIVSELVRGVTLADRLTAGRLSPREAAALCLAVAEALDSAHESGVVHRDLKPSNIMLDVEGQPHLMDFGLAKREAGEITVTVDGRVLGTPAYMSPEQARGESHHADRRSDVYSLGVILFELLTGELPFRGNTRMLLMQIIHDEPPGPRKLDGAVPRDLETICLKCLQKAPDGRYAAARELAEELRRWLKGEPIRARPVGRAERSWRWCRRNPTLAASLAAVAGSLVCGAAAASFFAVRAQHNAQMADANATAAELNAAAASRSADEAKTLAAESQAARSQAERQTLSALESLARAAIDRASALRTSPTAHRRRNALAEISTAVNLRPAMRELAERVGSGEAGARARQETLWQELLPRLTSEAVFWLTETSLRRYASYDFPAHPGTNELYKTHERECLVFSPDGRWVARLVLPEGTKATTELQVSDVEAGTVLWTATLESHAQLVSPSTSSEVLAFAPDGGQVFAARRLSHYDQGRQGRHVEALILESYATASGKQLRAAEIPLDAKGPGSQSVNVSRRIVLSADCRYAFVTFDDGSGESVVVDIDSGRRLWGESNPAFRPRAFTGDGKFVMAFLVEQQGPNIFGQGQLPEVSAVEVRDTATGAKVRGFKLAGWADMPRMRDYPWISPDGKWLAGWEKSNGLHVAIVDAETGQPRGAAEVQVPAPNPRYFAGLGGFVGDGRFLVVAMRDSLKVISVPDGILVHSQPTQILGAEPDPLEAMRTTIRAPKPWLSRLQFLGDGTRLALGAVVPIPQPERPMGRNGIAISEPLKKEMVELWDLALPQLNPETVGRHAGLKPVGRHSALLSAADRDTLAQPHYYPIGSAQDMIWHRSAVSPSPDAKPADPKPAISALQALWWAAGDNEAAARHPDWYDWDQPTDVPGMGFDASSRVFLALGGSALYSPPIPVFEATTGRFLKLYSGDGQIVSEDRRRLVTWSKTVAQVINLADDRELARFDVAPWGGSVRAVSPRANYLLGAEGSRLHVGRVADGTTATIALPAWISNDFNPSTVFSDDEASVTFVGQSQRTLVDLTMGREPLTLEITAAERSARPATTGKLDRIAFFRAESPAGEKRQMALQLWNQGDPAPTPLGQPWLGSYDFGDSHLAFSRDGSRLIVRAKLERDDAYPNGRGAIEIWDAEHRQLLGSTRDRPGNATAFIVYDEPRRLVILYQSDPNERSTARTELWDPRAGKLIAEYTNTCPAWPTGHSSWSDSPLRETGSKAVFTTFEVPPGADQRATRHHGETAFCRLIDLLAGDEQLRIKGAPLNSTTYKLAPNGDPLVIRDNGQLIVWRMNEKRHLRLPIDVGDFLALSPDGRQLVTSASNVDDSLRFWDTATGEPRGGIEPFLDSHLKGRGGNRVTGASFAPDGRRLAITVSGQTRLVDVDARKTYAALPQGGHRGIIPSAELAGDAQLVATPGTEGTVALRDAVTGDFRGLLDGFGAPVRRVEFIDSERLATLDAGGGLVVWRLTRADRGGFPAVEGAVVWRAQVGSAPALALPADGTWIATIAEDGAPALYASDDGHLLRRFAAPGASRVAARSDGKILAATGTEGSVRLFDPTDGRLLAEWPAGQGEITALAFSADGRLLATAGRDVRLWRVADRQRLLTFDSQQARVHELRFDAAGKTLLFAQTDRTGKESEINLIDLAAISGALAELGFQSGDLPGTIQLMSH